MVAMSEQQSQVVSVEVSCVAEIRKFLSFEMSPDQVLAFVAHVEDCLGCRHYLDRLSGLLTQRGYVNRRLAERGSSE
jgi:hypothetical protein